MIYESSYDSGRLPYKPDLTRGYWAKPSDFILTGISLAFRLDTFSLAWIIFKYAGCASFLMYIICLFVFVVPLFIMQSFLGQFSSSGFISAFRVAPLFKGIGYISLVVNFSVLTYYSIFAAIPLFYLLNSMRPTLPWSCEGVHSWLHKHQEVNVNHYCYISYNETRGQYGKPHVPSSLFFRALFTSTEDFEFSWELLLCTLVVWMLIAGLFYRWNKIEKLSSILRCGIFVVFILLLVIVIRFFLVLEDPWTNFYNFWISEWRDALFSIQNVVIYVGAAFGAGWGAVIALASFNKFQTPIIQNSWTICCGQTLVFFAFTYIIYATDKYFEEISHDYEVIIPDVIEFVSHQRVLFLFTGSVMAKMAWPNLWCILLYTLLLLAALITMITCLFSTLQSLFDEFERFRSQKTEVTFIVIGVLAVCSFYTCSNYSVFFWTSISHTTIITQTALNLLLILVVLWVYGRVRFQRDIKFMLGKGFDTWKVYMLRFVSPLCLIIILLFCLVSIILYHIFSTYLYLFGALESDRNLYTTAAGYIFGTFLILTLSVLLFVVIPWLYIPGYAIYVMLQTTGTFKTRFKRCVRPVDWYPLKLEDRQLYEEVMQHEDMTHQINQMDVETAT